MFRYGVEVNTGICDTYETFVWEATIMKSNCITAATEAACLVLSVDETVRNPASEKPGGGMPGMGKGKGRGMGKGMRGMRGRGGR